MITKFRLFSIEARRAPNHEEIPLDIRKDYKSNVPHIDVESKKKAIISFGFMVHYSSLGIIRMEGTLVYKGKTDQLKKEWEAEKVMPDDISAEVHDAIMEGCIPEAVAVARDIGLPPPIPIPRSGFHRKGK